jgi:hypothetical protein
VINSGVVDLAPHLLSPDATHSYLGKRKGSRKSFQNQVFKVEQIFRFAHDAKISLIPLQSISGLNRTPTG